MKINELLAEEQLDELDPGQVPSWYDPRKYFGQGKQNAQAAKQDKAYADQILKQWSLIAVRMKAALKNDPQARYKEGEYFKSFLSRALRIPANSDVFKQVSAMLGADNKNYPKQAKAAINQAVAMRFMAQFPMQSQQGQQQQGRSRSRNRNRNRGQANPAPTANKTVNAGNLGNWTWNGTQWVNPAGSPAGGNLVAQLDQLAAQQGIVK